MRKPLSSKKRARILRRDNFTCCYCLGTFEPRDLHVDHQQPVSWNGPSDSSNYVTACRWCNQAKGSRPIRPLTQEEAITVFVRAVTEPENRVAHRQHAAVGRGDVPVNAEPMNDIIFNLQRHAEIARRGKELRERQQRKEQQLSAIMEVLRDKGLL